MKASRGFIKMDGIGNDFIIFDAREKSVIFDAAQIQSIARRSHPETGGCDQVIVMERSQHADCFMRIFNADGSEAASCGNASRCIAWLLTEEKSRDAAIIDTLGGLLHAKRTGAQEVCVDMGMPGLEWEQIPLTRKVDTLHLPVANGPLEDPVGVSMGNPHAVFFIPDAGAVDLDKYGQALERHSLFQERANIGIAEVQGQDRIRLRVFERGAGETKACGTGACAALVAAHRRGLTGRTATVQLNGGDLLIHWRDDGHVLMTGTVSKARRGQCNL